MKKKILIWFSTIIGIIFIGTILVTATYLINPASISENFVESQEQMRKESEYKTTDDLPISTLDNFTDSLMLLTASYNGEEPLMDKAMNAYRYVQKGKSPYGTITGDMKQENLNKQSYARYWHGYLVVLKPLLTCFNYTEIRVINTVFQIGLFITLIVLLIRKRLAIYITPIVSVYLLINPITIFNSLQYSTIWYIVLISTIAYLLLKDKIVEKNLHYLLFTITGMITSFFDLLTYPIVTLGFLLILVIIAEDLDWKETLKRIFISGMFWTLGYGIMWASKWIIASIILNENVIKNALDTILSRSSNKTNSGNTIKVSSIFERNFSKYDNTLTQIVMILNFIGGLAIVCYYKIRNNKHIKELKETNQKLYKKISKKNNTLDKKEIVFETLKNASPILLIALFPFVWYLCLKNHSYIHSFFTFRTLSVFWLAILVTIFKIIKELKDKIKI